MEDTAPFARAAVLGTGLVGGSFALALRRCFPGARIAGWDRREILYRAKECGAVDECFDDPTAAIRGADFIYLALPIGTALDLLPAISNAAGTGALVTDSCSTKVAVCKAATRTFRGGARFLGGHPMAGKEVSGIEHADADLFRGARYAIIAEEKDADFRVKNFASVVRVIGAEPVWCDAETHDWAVAIVSHLPQLVSLGIARVVLDETDESGLPISLAGSGLRDALRLAGSPYEMWRDICLTNKENIARSLDRTIQALEDLRARLTGRELEGEFRAANELYEILHEMK